MKSRGVVFEKPFGSSGERLPHPLRVRLIDGPNADPESPGFCLLGDAPIGATVTVEYSPHDPFARLVSEAVSLAPASEPAGARMVDAAPESAPERASNETDIEGSCPRCEAFAIVELTARLKARQPDGTTHVCHPSFGGCNAGFSPDPRE